MMQIRARFSFAGFHVLDCFEILEMKLLCLTWAEWTIPRMNIDPENHFILEESSLPTPRVKRHIIPGDTQSWQRHIVRAPWHTVHPRTSVGSYGTQVFWRFSYAV